DSLDHQIVEVAPLVPHRLAQRARVIEIPAVERLDRAVHRRTRHPLELLLREPPLRHRSSLRSSRCIHPTTKERAPVSYETQRFSSWDITLPRADIECRRAGHIFASGWHIGYVWGSEAGEEYL